MSGHAILKNLYEKKMDVILTISFKITVVLCYVTAFRRRENV